VPQISLFNNESARAARQPKTDRLILKGLLENAAGSFHLTEEKISTAHTILVKWADMESAGRLAKFKETQMQGQFLQEVFGAALGYTLLTENAPRWYQEQHRHIGSETPDAVLGKFSPDSNDDIRAVIELKGPESHLDRDRTRHGTAVDQCWNYLVNTPTTCRWGIVSNIISFRLYERDSTKRRYEHFTLQSLRKIEQFKQFYALFHRQGLIDEEKAGQLLFVHGNSLVHDPAVDSAGFNWREKFPEVFNRPLADARGSESEPRPSGSGNTGLRITDKPSHSDCLAYFITFHTYGSWLHGTQRGSVDRDHNIPETELLPPDVQRERTEFLRLKQAPVLLDDRQRPVVEQAIREVCQQRGWRLHAMNVRTNHVHIVVTADVPPEKAMNDFKSYATRAMRRAKLCQSEDKIWSRHGSTPYLWDEKAVEQACQYMIEGQGAELSRKPLANARGSDSAATRPPQRPLADARGSESEPRPSGSGAGGFDCVIGNPPWERIKLQEREFFSLPAPEIATATNAAKRRELVAKLEFDNPGLYQKYQQAQQSADSLLNYYRQGEQYPLTGRGDINLYAVFAELAHQIVAPNGRVGLLTPSGIASDMTTKDFFAIISENNRLIRLFDFENRTKHFFPEVDNRFKFCILNFGGSEHVPSLDRSPTSSARLLTRAARNQSRDRQGADRRVVGGEGAADFVFFAHSMTNNKMTPDN
jgi:REP element-mobilizing transposase RayT